MALNVPVMMNSMAIAANNRPMILVNAPAPLFPMREKIGSAYLSRK